MLLAAGMALGSGCVTAGARQAALPPGFGEGVTPTVAVTTPADQVPALLGSLSSTQVQFAVDRMAHAVAFEVGPDGRARILFPASPAHATLVMPGARYQVQAWRTRTFQPGFSFVRGGARGHVPYVVVLVSEAAPDLTGFGRGSRWRTQLPIEGPADVDDVTPALGKLLFGDEDADYAADYAYLSPPLGLAQQRFLAECAVRGRGARDYQFYRDVWGVFDPSDPTFGPPDWSAMLSWSGGLFGVMGPAYWMDRATFATGSFYGWCGANGMAAPQFAFRPWPVRPQQAPPTTPPTGGPPPVAAPGPRPPAGPPRVPKLPTEVTELSPAEPATPEGAAPGGAAGAGDAPRIERPAPRWREREPGERIARERPAVRAFTFERLTGPSAAEERALRREADRAERWTAGGAAPRPTMPAWVSERVVPVGVGQRDPRGGTAGGRQPASVSGWHVVPGPSGERRVPGTTGSGATGSATPAAPRTAPSGSAPARPAPSGGSGGSPRQIQQDKQ